jgi:hypothetical protein
MLDSSRTLLRPYLPVGGDDLPHVEHRACYPCATATLSPTDRYAGVTLCPGCLFGGPPQTLVLGDVQDDAYTFSALVREVARFHPLYCSRSADLERPGYATVGLSQVSLLGRSRFLYIGDEREVMLKGSRGDPSVGYSYWASMATRAVSSFGPPETQGTVEGIDDEVA